MFQTDFDFVSLFGAIGGVAAFTSAYISWRALVATRTSSEARVALDFMQEYSQPEMSDALRLTRSYFETHSHEPHLSRKWLQALRSGDEDAIDVDRARRHISHYFARGFQLYKNGYVSSRFVETALLIDGLSIYLDMVMLLEIELGADPTQEIFEFYKNAKPRDFKVRRTSRTST